MALTRTLPALPVRDINAAVAHYREQLRFSVLHVDDAFAVLQRDGARLHLWRADDVTWSEQDDLRSKPVRTGAESFLAGTASCRVEVDDIDGLYTELAPTGVLHPVSRVSVTDTEFGTREFGTLDVDGNLVEFFRSAR